MSRAGGRVVGRAVDRRTATGEGARRAWPAVVVRTAARRVVADRGGLAFTAVFYALVTTVLSSLWRLAAGASTDGTVAGYTAAQLTWYVAATEACTISLNTRLIADLGDDIGSGAVAVELLRPVRVVGLRVATEVGRVLPRLALCATVGAVLAGLAVGAPPSATAVALALPAMALAVTANLLAQHAFAAASFWLRGAASAWYLYHKFVFILGGMLLPLEVMPDGLRRVATALPFAVMAYAAGRLSSGHVEPWLLALQLGWMAALWIAAAAAFAAGERRLLVVGA